MVNSKSTNQCINLWIEGTSSHEFELYRQIQEQFSVNTIWSYAKHNPSIMYACFTVAQLIAYSATFDSYCTRCDRHDIQSQVLLSIVYYTVIVYNLVDPHLRVEYVMSLIIMFLIG